MRRIRKSGRAGATQNFNVAPINYGNARRILAWPRRPDPRGPEAQPSVMERNRAPPACSRSDQAAGNRRGRKRKLDFSNLSNLVEELQEVVAERDRLLAALDQIASIIRNV